MLPLFGGDARARSVWSVRDMIKRVFLFVLDSVGAGEAPDAAAFGDVGANTLRSAASSAAFCADTLVRMGLGNIDGLSFLGIETKPVGAYGRLTERSLGKDTTIGHWEIAGIVSPKPLPTYPHGFPEDVIAEFSDRTGRGVLCNRPYSGTEVIRDFGEEHLRTGTLIVYTSADSVFQIAAHESIVPDALLYEYCRIARAILTGEHGVGRVIARPFTGEPGAFVRTPNRRDFSVAPPRAAMPELIRNAGLDSIAVGKISDIFAGQGFTESIPAHGNRESMEAAMRLVRQDFHGLSFINLVDFDMLYGHRRDIPGYAAAIAEFDRWLPSFLSQLCSGDVLMITADHGCDPGFVKTTDHTREYVPLLVYGDEIRPANLGTRSSFADIAATVCEWLGVRMDTPGESFAALLK